MSESREKKQRYYDRMEYFRKFQIWLSEEPPRWKIFSYRRWIAAMPDYAGVF